MKPQSKLWYFENFKILDVLSKEEKEDISHHSMMKQPDKKQLIHFSDAGENKIYFVKAGKVKISKYSENGNEIILAILGPGEIFGELAITGQSAGDEVAEIVEDAVICELSTDEMQKMLESNPKFNLQITKLIGLKFKKIQNRLESLYFRSAPDRIREFIKDLAAEHGEKTGKENEVAVNLNLTHEDIAKLTATTRQTVTSVFNELEKDGIIEYSRKQILIKDQRRL